MEKHVITGPTLCFKCCGNIYHGKKHICEESLLERGFKFDPKVKGSVVKATPEELKAMKEYLDKKVKTVQPTKDQTKDTDAITRICESILVQLDKATNEKEVAAIKERFEREVQKFKDKKPLNIPDIIEKVKAAFAER